MRLIHSKTLEFHDFYTRTPPYAILSHTWEIEEVTYQEMISPTLRSAATTKTGYRKIVQACRLALEQNLDYVWVDTCCIDKTSSAELTESINSMFQWYQQAAVCFAHLSDLTPESPVSETGGYRWFTRGWTLQELIAPPLVQFFDQTWAPRGSKTELWTTLHTITRIPGDVLRMKRTITYYSVAQRMSWASGRLTTRTEDIAYCLLGIFDVNMPLLYGEGRKAFRRLQEEIVKHNNDTTIFAWNPDGSLQNYELCSLFAPSPAMFSESSRIMSWDQDVYNPEFLVTNKGLRLEDYISIIPGPHYVQFVGMSTVADKWMAVGIRISKVGPNVYFRQSRPLELVPNEQRVRLPRTTSDILHIGTHHRPSRMNLWYHASRAFSIFIDVGDCVTSVVPEALWDHAEDCFFFEPPRPVRALHCARILNGEKVSFVILCQPVALSRWKYSILDSSQGLGEEMRAQIFQHRSFSQALTWEDLIHRFPGLCESITNKFTITVRDTAFVLSVIAVERVVITDNVPFTTYRLRLEAQERRDEPCRVSDT